MSAKGLNSDNDVQNLLLSLATVDSSGVMRMIVVKVKDHFKGLI